MEADDNTASEEWERIIQSFACEGLKETHLFVYGDFKGSKDKINCSNGPSFFIKSMKDMLIAHRN